MRVFLFSVLLLSVVSAAPGAPGTPGTPESAAPASAPNDNAGWSPADHGLQARLTMAHKGAVVGTRIVATYLELRNVSDDPEAMDIPLDLPKVQFTVTDAAGKEVEPTDDAYDGQGIQLGNIRLPYDSYVRYNIAGRGGGVPRQEAAALDLGPGHVWVFKAGDKGTYFLQAKIVIAQPKDRRWSGTVELPKVKIPTMGE